MSCSSKMYGNSKGFFLSHVIPNTVRHTHLLPTGLNTVYIQKYAPILVPKNELELLGAMIKGTVSQKITGVKSGINR